MNDINRYRELGSKWLKNDISEAEKEEFLAWYDKHPDEELLIPRSFAENEVALKERILSKVNDTIDQPSKSTPFYMMIRKSRLVAALMLVISFFGIGYYYIQEKNTTTSIALSEIQPGSNKATLTLENGDIIDLENEEEGLIVGDDLHYHDGKRLAENSANELETSYITLTTPRGGEYQLKLSDGTRVWLNAASTIRFPRKFMSNKREIELLEGEVFFDVASKRINDKKVPFLVKNKEQLVEVLGTQFNINTYDKKLGVVTTVAEGTVAVTSNDQSLKDNKVLLTMGMQAQVNQKGIKKQNVDVDDVLAWKNGFFYFDEADIYSVLGAFERWYNIDVSYEIKRSDDLFYGKLPKNVTLDKALHILKTAGIKFEVKNKQQLIIKNNK